MFPRFARSRSLLIEINPHQVLVAGITRERRGPTTIDFAAEFDRENTNALRLWLETRKDLRKKWMNAVGGFVAKGGVLQRETLKSADLSDPAQLIEAIRERQTRRFAGSSAPFYHIDAGQWTLRGVNAQDGTALPADNATRPTLLFGIANEELHQIQQQLIDLRLMPQHLEPAQFPLFGSIYQIMESRHHPQAALVFVIQADGTEVYILGKEGVHTPGQVSLGLNSLVQQVRKEFALNSDKEALQRLLNPDDELRKRARKLLRPLGAELRPIINSYEMTTGQPAGGVYCAYLPPGLAWLAEALVEVLDHEPMAIDCQQWMATVGLRAAPDLPPFGSHWLGALSLAANLPDAAGRATKIARAEGGNFQRPWHVDSQPTIEPPDWFVGRRFLSGAVAAAFVALALAFTAWQWYLSRSLQADTDYWRGQMASNQKLVEELITARAELSARTIRLGHAHALMKEPYQVTEFLMNIGRSLPPHLRIDRIDGNENRVVLAGILREPAEEASVDIGRYLESLRRMPRVGLLFASISATSLQREREADALSFEITMRLNPPPS